MELIVPQYTFKKFHIWLYANKIKSTFVAHILTMLDHIITSKTRIRLLVKFFINAANTGYLRGLAKEMEENTNAIRKELNNLSEAGIIIRDSKDAKVMYRANKAHPFFALLQQIVRKHIGLDEIIQTVVSRMGDVKRIYLTGDYTEGIDSGIIEIVLEGPEINQAYLDHLRPKIEQEIDKKINFHITPHFNGDGLLVFELD
jgi:predicted transcriptional regulator